MPTNHQPIAQLWGHITFCIGGIMTNPNDVGASTSCQEHISANGPPIFCNAMALSGVTVCSPILSIKSRALPYKKEWKVSFAKRYLVLFLRRKFDADPQFFQLVANWYHTNAFCATKLRWLCILFMYTMNVSLLMVLVPLRLWYLPTKSVGWHSGVICKILWYMYMFMPYKYYWYYVSLLFECVLPM